ncbi:DUF262 domain-containing protein [Campylobacter lari]|uniref:DUF262 domain-containing protein n=1 Tax=Campylobacter lari TaxID=201 RepID=UPI0021C086A0|nr:DUF262 domain-containing HNH endonuclease family protein [Campylobacter lari]
MPQSQESVAQVFSREKFSIPQYQRDYAWKKENFIDLWEDLEEALDLNEYEHFLGTLVVSPNNHNDKFDIIDGQQRTTTIFMLLYALIHKSNFRESYKFKYLLDKHGNFKLEVSPQNQDFFTRLLLEVEKWKVSIELKNTADTQGKRNLCEVFTAILDKVSLIEDDRIECYINTLQRMILVWLEESNPGKAIKTFQSVNDRGVELRLLDKLKSLLIYYSNTYCKGETSGLDKNINEKFGIIFKIFLQIEHHKYISNIGNQQFSEDDIFRYHSGSIKFSEIPFLGHYRKSSKATYSELKIKLKDLSKKNIEDLESFIRSYIEDLTQFYQAFLDLLNEIDQNPTKFKVFLLEKINPYFYNSIIRLKINNELDDEILELFAKADILFFKSGGSLDATAYNLINQCLIDKETLQKEIISQCKKCNYAKKSLQNLVDYTYDEPSFHYVFFEKNCKDMNIDDLKTLIETKIITQEKEHIIPFSLWENNNEIEIKKLGFDNIDDFANFMDTYGNLLSLEKKINTKAQDKDLFEKSEIYKESKLPFVRCFDVKNFNKNILKERNENFKLWLQNNFFKDFFN